MRFDITSLCLLATTVGAYNVPKKQPDGVYAVRTNAFGDELHTYLGPPATQEEVASFARLSNGTTSGKPSPQEGVVKVNCFNAMLRTESLAAARASLAAQCGNGGHCMTAQGGQDVYAISGNVVAYACNIGKTNAVCMQSKVLDTIDRLNRECTPNTAGEATVVADEVIYGATLACKNFCKRGVTGHGTSRCDDGGDS